MCQPRNNNGAPAQSVPEEGVKRLHAENRLPTPPRITLDAYLLDAGDHRILIDSLNAIGLDAGAIDTVLITHMHPDHVGGLIDADDQPVFPKARVLVPSGEIDYWGGDIPEGASEILKKQFQSASRVIAAVGSRMQRLEGTEVLPGITRVPLPGHTPDHSGYRIVSGEDRILVWTDIVHLPGIQFSRPEATVAFDVDPPQAATTRRRIMAELAESRELVAGHHLDFPGIGYVAEDGDGFRFFPHVWAPTV